MSRPLDRNCRLPALGKLDTDAGEFWAENPMDMPRTGDNLSAYERNRVFLNVPGRGFVDVSFASQADIDSDSRSVVAADFDRDGAPDLLVGSVGGGPLRLFENRFPKTAHRVRLDLVGVTSNRAAIGTRVVAYCGGRQIVRDLFLPNGCMGQGPPEMILGLGDANNIDRLTVRWPTGKTEEFLDLPVDCVISIREGEKHFTVQKPAAASAVDKPVSRESEG